MHKQVEERETLVLQQLSAKKKDPYITVYNSGVISFPPTRRC